MRRPPMPRLALLPLAAVLACTGCAGLAQSDRGPLQPQTVDGPCHVEKFYILNLITVHTRMTVANTGQSCRFTVFNPDLQVLTTAALVTGQPAHGQAQAGLTYAGFQAAVAYTPAPGFTGHDRFDVTLEPSARGITVDVTVGAPGTAVP